jgi:hypothetical protein
MIGKWLRAFLQVMLALVRVREIPEPKAQARQVIKVAAQKHVAAFLVDLAVKPEIELDQTFLVVALRELRDPIERGSELRDLVAARVAQPQLPGQALGMKASGVERTDIFERHRRDVDALARENHQPFGGEPQQRFADRRTPHPDLAHQCSFVDERPGGKSAPQDELANRLIGPARGSLSTLPAGDFPGRNFAPHRLPIY